MLHLCEYVYVHVRRYQSTQAPSTRPTAIVRYNEVASTILNLCAIPRKGEMLDPLPPVAPVTDGPIGPNADKITPPRPTLLVVVPSVGGTGRLIDGVPMTSNPEGPRDIGVPATVTAPAPGLSVVPAIANPGGQRSHCRLLPQ